MSGCRVTVDTSRCSGIGMCEGLAPDLFEVGDDGRAHLLVDRVDGSRFAELEEIASACPTRSVTVERQE